MAAKKNVRFSTSEKLLFSKIYNLHKMDFEIGKDRVSREKNDCIWARITKEFNSCGDIGTTREVAQLKKLFANNKQMVDSYVEEDDVVESEEPQKTLEEDNTAKNNAHDDTLSDICNIVNEKKRSLSQDDEEQRLSPTLSCGKHPRVTSGVADASNCQEKKADRDECDLSEEELRRLRLKKIIEHEAELAKARMINENQIAFIKIRFEEELSRVKLEQARELFALERRTALVKLKTERIAQDRLMKMENEDSPI